MAQYNVKRGGMHEAFLKSRNKVQMIGGGFGNGKTAAGCIKALQLAKDYPGSNGIIAMATYKQLNDTIRKEFFKWCPKSSISRAPTTSDNTAVLTNGSQINFRYLQQKGKTTSDGSTSSNLLSATYDWAVVDQIENPSITHKDFLDLLGRLRGSTAYRGFDETMPLTGPRWLILLANPSQNWVYHKLIKPMHTYKATGQITEDLLINRRTGQVLIDLFEASTYENAHNLEADFIEAMESAYTGQMRERFLMGKWGAFEGLVYPNFDQNVHMVSLDLLTSYMMECRQKGIKLQALEGLDYGIASPTCYLLGFQDSRQRIFIVDGFYQPGLDTTTIAAKIEETRAKYAGFFDYRYPILADPSIFNKTVRRKEGEGATTIASLIETAGMTITFQRAQNDIMSGITKISSYLSLTKFPHFVDSTMPGPMLYINSSLMFIADEMGAYFFKANPDGSRTDQPIDANDHALDTLKYLMSYVDPATNVIMATMADFEERQLWSV